MWTVAMLVGCTEGELLEAGADILQSTRPVRQIDLRLSGFHYASGSLDYQMQAEHYCHRVDDDFTQCILYDGADRDARMIGVEYIMSRRAFDTLPRDEQMLWHPHTWEVLSGTLVAPGLPIAAEHELMEMLVSTYGKTWHIWDSEMDAEPVGLPTLMKAFTEDGQLDPGLISDRDATLDIDTPQRQANRSDIADPGFDPIVLEEPEVCREE